MFDGLDRMFQVLFVFALFGLTLGVWKAVEILIRVFSHLRGFQRLLRMRSGTRRLDKKVDFKRKGSKKNYLLQSLLFGFAVLLISRL